MMFDPETLAMLFDETGLDFNSWKEQTGYDSSWSDQAIYAALPQAIIEVLSDLGMNASWMHGGM